MVAKDRVAMHRHKLELAKEQKRLKVEQKKNQENYENNQAIIKQASIT